jgi:hypothetical protein
MFFLGSNVTCFAFYVHLWPIYRLSLVIIIKIYKICQRNDIQMKLEIEPTAGILCVWNVSLTRYNVWHNVDMSFSSTPQITWRISGRSVRLFIFMILQYSKCFSTLSRSELCWYVSQMQTQTFSYMVKKIRIRCVSFAALSLYRLRSHPSRLLIFHMKELPCCIFSLGNIYMLIIVAARSEAWTAFTRSNNWDRGFESHLRHGWLCAFILCSCCPVCRGWSPVERLLTVWKLKKLKQLPRSNKGL